MKSMGKKLDKKLVEDLCDCGESHYCTLKELLKIVSTFEPRFIVQLKCIEIYKYEAGTRFHTDIGWQEATMEWVEIGYASIFADVYDEAIRNEEEIHCRVLYNRICERAKALEEHR